MQLAPGDVFAGYRVVRQIGSGGMGSVYLVEHPRLPRRDALKLLNRELSAEPDFVARFMREADIVSGLAHRNIVSIYDRGEEAGQLWLTMRHVDGIDAEAALDQAGGMLPAPRAVHIVSEVAAALDAAHRRQLIHRDVKPANVLLCQGDDDEPEQVFLTDFGIAKSLDAGSRLTRTGLVVATFDYASPEQIEAEPLDGRSDVYSLGCVLYKLLTGSVPYPGETMLAPAAGHLSLPPPRPTALVPWLAPALDDVIARAMAKKPADRYATCRALAAAAAAAMDDFPAPPPPPYRVFVSRPADGSGVEALLGPIRTDGMSEQDTARLVTLVRRTRFFDLPSGLAGPADPPGRRRVTLEIGCTGRIHRVVADLDNPRHPPEFEDLVATVERMPTAGFAGRAAPPTQRGPSPSRFSRPPPPLPPPAVPVPVTERQATAAPLVGAVALRSGPLPQVPARSGPPTPPPVQAPLTPPPDPPWTAQSNGEPERRRRRVRGALLAVLTAAVVAGATTWFLVDRTGDDGGGSDEPSASATSAPRPTTAPTLEARQAWFALPRTPDVQLDEDTLVAAREVDGNTDLYLIEADGALGPRLTTADQDDESPLISKDRRAIIYVREYDTGRELRTVTVDGLGDRPLFDQPLSGCGAPSRPAWNFADPTQIALVCYDEPEATLRVVSLDGVTLHEFAPPRAHVDDLTFSPNGSQLAYFGTDRRASRVGDLYVQIADGSENARRLTTTGTDNYPIWSPDGSTIAFSHGIGDGAREIRSVIPDDPPVEPHRIVESTGNSAETAPAWSPDGMSIVFRSDRGGSDQWWVAHAEGGEPQLLTQDGRAIGSPAWGNR